MTFEGAILDLDGTVYRGDRLLPGAARGVAALRDAGVDPVFLSNNPTRTPAAIAAALEELGLSVAPGAVLTSAVVTREYLRESHPDARLFVIGDPGFREQLSGFATTDDPTAADAVVVAVDRAFDYDRLADAHRALAAGAAFVATDPDPTVPAADGREVPWTGAITAAVTAAAGRGPDRIPGKPSGHAARAALDRLGVAAADCLVVGDRLDTDVALGNRVGATTALVLTGADDAAALDEAAVEAEPDHVLDSLGGVDRLLRVR